MNRRGVIGLGLAAAAAAVTAAPVRRSFDAALTEARARIAAPAALAATRFGPVQWAEAGDGPPVLMLHGTGGGFDQGLLFCRRLASAGWRVIAPSRFGYLGTPMPAAASPAAEADAMADLLDTVGIARLPVMGGSAGAIPAIEFAIRHPDRCAALVAIVPAAHAPGRPPMRPGALGAAVMRHALRSDFLFWAGMELAEDTMIRTLLATDPALVRAMHPAERARARDILRTILPVSARAEGLLHDARWAGDPPEQPLERIAAPTLAVACEDDFFLTHDAARHIARTVPDAELVSFPTGGHIWVGHDAEVFAAIDAFLRRRA